MGDDPTHSDEENTGQGSNTGSNPPSPGIAGHSQDDNGVSGGNRPLETAETESTKLTVGWIYTLNKPTLLKKLQRCGLDTEGTVDVLRKRLVRFVREIGEIPETPEEEPNIPLVPISSATTATSTVTFTMTGSPPASKPITSTAPICHTREFPSRTYYVPATQLPADIVVRSASRTEGAFLRSTLPDPRRIPEDPPCDVRTSAFHPGYADPQWLRDPSHRSQMPPFRSEFRREPEQRIPPPTRPRQPPPSTFGYSPGVPPINPWNNNLLFEQVRRWRVQFDGKTDPVAFLERIEELLDSSGTTGQQLLTALPEVFQGQALAWYRNNRNNWESWEDFLRDFNEFFLPRDYEFFLEDKIANRKQKPQETGREYVLEMQTLLRQYGKTPMRAGLKRIYNNLLPQYRHYIRSSDFDSINELLVKIQEFEDLLKEVNIGTVASAPRTDNQQGTFAIGKRRVSYAEYSRPAQSAVSPPRNYSSGNSPTQSRPPPRPGQTPQNDQQQPAARNAAAPIPTPQGSHSRTTLMCWRCGEEGHLRATCQGRPRVFCSRCQRPGIMSRDCPCNRQEN